MTQFLDVHELSQFVRNMGPQHLMAKLVDYLEQDYLNWAKFDKSARLAAHSDVGVIELMPIADDQLYSFKYVNGHPSNTAQGLPTVMAFGVLAEVATGYPLLLSELTLVTALRTAATSAMAAKYLARQDAKTMALIGNGCQSEFQSIAFHKLLGINEIRCYDVDYAASAKLKANLDCYTDLRLVICESAHEACASADIITTVTADKRLATILTPDMIAPGQHINAIGGDCPGKTELHRDVLTQADTFVEYEPQSRIEGDIQQLPEDYPVTELWQVIAKQQPGRQNDHQITVFDSVGFALEDYSALRMLYEFTQQGDSELGQTLGLIPHLSNPKNLFGLLVNPDGDTGQFKFQPLNTQMTNSQTKPSEPTSFSKSNRPVAV
ncbi:ornithine cyclodeaminase [Oceanospirillum sediminis]|uniref:Ornithine cyclodeaminase n=1 Tax=Oceanospirillum sediminis TaxID=2760088 RepID=A0A839IT21_9GAMM|nr:ornithine cyclodeaminase [Oceanospirillum sediminis]MBB1487577.1 ornithine cyclodeaminase [Oceanospirillum sediminis]